MLGWCFEKKKNQDCMENDTLYRVFLMISIFISSRSWKRQLTEHVSAADRFFLICWSIFLSSSHLLIDARLKEGCKGGVDQDSIVKLSRSAGQKERLEFSWTGVMMSNTLKATNCENQIKPTWQCGSPPSARSCPRGDISQPALHQLHQIKDYRQLLGVQMI